MFKRTVKSVVELLGIYDIDSNRLFNAELD